MDFIQSLNQQSLSYPKKAPPILVGHPLIGRIGEVHGERGFKLRYMSERSLRALLKDEVSARKALREMGAITSWDGVLAARAVGKADDQIFVKASQTTVASNWSSFYRSGGFPAAGTYTNIPGGASHNNASLGACTLLNPGTDKKYLLNVGVNHLTGINVVLVADLLVGAGNIVFTSSPVTVNSVALTRYMDGAGVMMIFEVTTVLTATPPTINVSYTNQGGLGGRATGAQALIASAAVMRLMPVTAGIIMPLAGGDYGVRSVESITLGATGQTGALALNLYKPLLFIPTLATTTWVERSVPAMLSGIVELVKESGGALGCLVFYVLTSTTSTGQQTYLFQTCAG